jgi:hypothetical protein
MIRLDAFHWYLPHAQPVVKGNEAHHETAMFS